MELLELGKNPISDQEPAGEDVRAEPEYEELEGEIGKLSSISATGGVDWDKVINLSQEILGQKSKNLLISCYLCVGLLKSEGLKGLAQGVHVIRDLLDNFWDTMYPPKKRMRGRANAITWWSEKVEAAIADRNGEKWQQADFDAFKEDLDALDAFLGENVEDAPLLRSLNDNILSLIETEPEPSPEEAVESSDQKSAKSDAALAKESAASAPQPQSAPSDTDGETLLKNGLDILGQAAKLYLEQEQYSPVPFQLNRIAAWMTVDSLPPADGGKTMVPPPDEQVVTLLNGMYQSQNWKDLLGAAESRVRQFLFWIDLSRYVAEALEELGHTAACEIVAQETANYVNRLSGIEKLTFSDGTPFANDETKEWLKSVANLQKGGGGDASSSLGDDEVKKLVAKETAVAHALIKEKKIAQALNEFRKKLNQASSLRDRFVWEIGLCNVMLWAKKSRLALPYIKEILKFLDEYKIEQWEPSLALEGLSITLSGLRLQEEGSKDEELIGSVLNRISALSPAAALDLL